MQSGDSPHSDPGSLNLRLAELYSAKLDAWKELRAEQTRAGHCLSIPLFLKASSAYLQTSPKIIFVGQETHGWWTNYASDPGNITPGEIMDFYERTWATLFDTYKRSPYWRAMRKIGAALGVDHPRGSFLFSNIFPCDLDRKPASPELMTTFRQWKILERELSILAPDYVIFFCGPRYAYNLEPYFGSPLPDVLSPQRLWMPYRPTGYTWKGVATYHPASLVRSRHGNVLDEIVNYIRLDRHQIAKTTDIPVVMNPIL
jgi:hypothetical protein